MKAIILAAGYGSRMYPLAQDKPKCLLTIKGETLLARQLRILRDCGIEDITIVTGFYGEKIAELYAEEASIRYNPHYEITGNIFSLWVVRDLLNDDVIISLADNIFTDELIRLLLADDNPYCLTVDKGFNEWKVKVTDNAIVEVSETIPVEEAYGGALGIGKIKKEGIEEFKKSLFECVKRNPYPSWVTISGELAKGGHRVNFILITSPWMDIDTREDYEEAQRLFNK